MGTDVSKGFKASPSCTEHIVKALSSTLEANKGLDENIDSWLEEAQIWLACNQEQVSHLLSYLGQLEDL